MEPQSKSEYRPEDITALNELILGNAIPTVNITTTSITTPLLILDDDVTTRPYIAPTTGNISDYQQSFFMGLKELYSWQPYYSKNMTDYDVNRFDLYDVCTRI